MPAHYAYQTPNGKRTLCQGDILQRTKPLVAHLRKYHSYYAKHKNYKYFMVLTQSCDLVRRKGKPCTSQYITIAAVRPVEEVLLREAAKKQDDWQKKAEVISAKDAEALVSFAKSLIDNNKERYFYLHTDAQLGIKQNCCCFLQLAVSLKAEHYDMCLEAKVCELQEPFQAKLGHQIGHMYNRVGATEWDDNHSDYSVDTFARELVDETFYVFEERQIKEGVADLKKKGTFKDATPEQVREYIDSKVVVPWKDKFKADALEALSTKSKPMDLIRGKLESAIIQDTDLKSKVDALLAESGVAEEARPAAVESMIRLFRSTLKSKLDDKTMPEKKEILEKIVAWLANDTFVSQSLRS